MKALTAIALIPLLATLAACSDSQPEAPTEQAGVQAALSTVQSVDLPERITLPGTVYAAQTAMIAASSGGRVDKVAVQAGDRVKAGQLLIEVDTAQARAGLAQAQAQLTQAETAWQQAQDDHKRFQSLLAEHAVTQREAEQVEHRYTAARAALDAARQGVAAARQQLSYARVSAPFAGIVTQRHVDAGDMVPPGTPLLGLSGGHDEVRVQVGEALFGELQLDTPAEIEVDGKTYPARIVQLVGAADPVTHTHLVKLVPEKTPGLTVGAYARAVLMPRRVTRLAVPSSAVIRRAGIDGVLVVDAAGVAHFREVRLAGHAGAKRTAVAAGLSTGERVVTTPTPEMGNGTRIVGGENE